MADVDSLAEHLKAHLRLCQDILTVVERENVTLKQSDAGNFELQKARKDILPELEKSLEELRTRRADWLQLTAAEREAHPEIAALLRQNQDVIMKIIVLDRENEQTLLRKGLVPPKHLPSANRNRPHYVADLYRRGGKS
jgi:flagellar biosynthesis/type III secretory pathway chaperone